MHRCDFRADSVLAQCWFPRQFSGLNFIHPCHGQTNPTFRLPAMILTTCLQSIAFAAFLVFPEGDKSLQGDMKSAYDAYKLGDLPKAAKLFQGLAAKGDKNAQFAVGRLAEEGRGIDRSLSVAESWYRKAAAQSHLGAQFNLAVILLNDPNRQLEGLKWLKDAATGGSSEAQLTLGQLYANGRGVEKNFDKAKELLDKAAEQGEENAFLLLAQMYETGAGVTQDVNKAIGKYTEAANRESLQAIVRLAAIYSNGLSDKDGKELMGKDPGKAREWLLKGAEMEKAATDPTRKTTVCLYNLGLLAETVDKKPEEAVKYFKLAAADEKNPNVGAAVRLGAMYATGTGVGTKDPKESFKWFELAAKAGAPVAMHALAVAYEKGEGVSASPKEAKTWLMRAGVGGFAPAMRELGIRYRDGNGLNKDILAAFTWLQRAMNSGDLESAMILSEMYEKGDELPRDLRASNALLTQVAQLGVAEAQVKLAENTAEAKGTPQDLIRAYALLLAAGDFEPAKKKREEMAKNMSKDQLAEAQKELERIKSKPPAAATPTETKPLGDPNAAPAPAPAPSPGK